MTDHPIDRRQILEGAAALGAVGTLAALHAPTPPHKARHTMRQLLTAAAVVLAMSLGSAYTARAAAVEGSGTFADTDSTVIGVRQADGNTFITSLAHGILTGFLSGSYTVSDITEVHDATGAVTFHDGTLTCACTVAGQSGTVTNYYAGMVTAAGSGRGHFVSEGSGGLAGLHGQGTFLPDGTYSGAFHFNP